MGGCEGGGAQLRCEELERTPKEGVLWWRMEGEWGTVRAGVHRASEP